MIVHSEVKEKYTRFFKIRCFTCGRDLTSKGGLARTHRGHDVHYINERGEIDE